MPLASGYTRFHGCVMNKLEASEFKKLERRLRSQIDARKPIEAQSMLHEIKEFAGDHAEYQNVFEDIRKQAAQRWQLKHGTSWVADFGAVING